MFGLRDDYVYSGLLISSIFFGKVIRTSVYKKWLSTLGGFFIVGVVSGFHTLHFIFTVLCQFFLLKVIPWRYVHFASFVFNFIYLFFFRLEDYFNLPYHSPFSNAVQMILTLKMIGLAFEFFDSRVSQNEEKIDPTLTDLFHYAFAHTGVLTGPYFKYQTFIDLYQKDFQKYGNCDEMVLKRLKGVPIYIVIFLSMGYFFPLKAVEDEAFYVETNVFYRIFYYTPVFIVFRMRFYIGFVLAECSCIAAGLGAYPKILLSKPGNGPTLKLEEKSFEFGCVDFETIHNIDEWKTEVAPTMRMALKQWNMTVQSWLAIYVYKRFPLKSLRTFMVMVVSSAWHGVYSGYYLSLGSIPFFLAVEDLYDKILRQKLPEKGQRVYDFISWFVRVQWFSYLSMGFQLLSIDKTFKFWRSVYFIGHASIPILLAVGYLVVKPLTNSFSKSNKKD